MKLNYLLVFIRTIVRFWNRGLIVFLWITESSFLPNGLQVFRVFWYKHQYLLMLHQFCWLFFVLIIQSRLWIWLSTFSTFSFVLLHLLAPLLVWYSSSRLCLIYSGILLRTQQLWSWILTHTAGPLSSGTSCSMGSTSWRCNDWFILEQRALLLRDILCSALVLSCHRQCNHWDFVFHMFTLNWDISCLHLTLRLLPWCDKSFWPANLLRVGPFSFGMRQSQSKLLYTLLFCSSRKSVLEFEMFLRIFQQYRT